MAVAGDAVAVSSELSTNVATDRRARMAEARGQAQQGVPEGVASNAIHLPNGAARVASSRVPKFDTHLSFGLSQEEEVS